MGSLLAGKVVAITGCSTGIGRAISLECARHGARLVLHNIGGTQAERDIRSLRQEIQAVHAKSESVDVAVDITQPEAGDRIVAAATDAFGEISCIVHNAGICRFRDFNAVTKHDREQHMSVNFHGPFAVTQAVVDQMKRQGTGGSVVSIASITATLGSAQLAHYSATKAAMLGMTVSCAVALGPHGIRFNAISPGTIETTMNKEDLGIADKRAVMEARVPLRRLGRPEDVAKPVVFLASDMADYVSGQNLLIDGGASVNYQ